eukprot:TRINITY_DN13133_c0_g1_i1.p1 TRINITY_DN13133_c0_g1~~TRINITY_DN13133_c0_g1_i1.p1  ORF type:complete len:145 (-),score=26.08 TRINITY_DN13133_c0_g1_i1:70-504(-)
MIFNLYIFGRKGQCIYYEAWNVNRKNMHLQTDNLFGLLFELKRFVQKTSVSGDPPEYFSYTTNKYRLHCFESATGRRFVMCTDPKSGSLANELREIYASVFVDTVVHNPLVNVNVDESIQNCEPFTAELTRYLQTLPVWRSPAH